MYVIGTAGHVDHGKSTLVQALTGIDPDRLLEEKERGMTVDLGFAWLSLPDGNEVSIVDVPGHERFVSNMLAGVGGIDLALLVVAADESVMPQTQEHLAILDLLNVKHGLVTITKKDLVDDDWLELVIADVNELLKDTTLQGSQVHAVSGSTREGLPELVSGIQTTLDQSTPKKDLGRPRLAIDRSFTMPGFGTVVTGTLVDGTLSVGQDVALVPSGHRSRVRGLQTHRQKVEHASPGSRVAVNLTGIPHDKIARGEILTTPNWLKPTSAIDVRLRVLEASPHPIRHNMFATVHTGSSESVARIRLLENDVASPGATTWAQIKIAHPIGAVKGDYYVIRSNQTTIGGGNIIDPHARRHRRNYQPVLERLSVMEDGSDRDVIIKSIEADEPSEFQSLVNRANLRPDDARAALKDMASEKLIITLGQSDTIGPGVFVFSSGGWASLAERACSFLVSYHQRFPLRNGAPKEELRSRLGMAAPMFGHALRGLQDKGVLEENGPLVRRPEHVRQLSKKNLESVDVYLKLLESKPYSPPTDSHIDHEILNLLDDQGKIVRVNESVVFSASAYDDMVEKIKELIVKSGEVTVADVRDMFDTSRKYALALLEYLDKQRITRRVGDSRILR